MTIAYRAIVALISFASVIAVAAPRHGPALDEAGNQRYMIMLDEEVARREPAGFEAPARHPMDLENLVDRFGWHRPNVRALVHRLERTYGLVAVNITSHTIPMFSAHIPSSALVQIAGDPAVTNLIPLNYDDLSFSTWADQISGSDRVPWGKIAVGTDDLLTTENVVYLIDGGIDPNYPHGDLNLSFAPVNPGSFLAPGHATHVGGILAAKMGTGRVRGVNPNASIINVNRGDLADGAATAMDWVLWHAEVSGIYAVANLSSVSDNSIPVRDAMATYIRRISNRVLLVQAAGNWYDDACFHAYPLTNSLDGILVVGGIDEDGRPVQVPTPGQMGYLNMNDTGYGDQPGSDYGSCVEVWAPSQRIWSTFWDPNNPTNVTGIARMSGTSMAAPYVAGLAARYGSTATTPVERERYIRAKLFATGFVDHAGIPIYMPSYLQPIADYVPYRIWPSNAYADASYPGTSPWYTQDNLYISTNTWNAGHSAPAWIEFDLGWSRCIYSVRLVPDMNPPSGDVFHYIYVGDQPAPQSAVAGISTSARTLEPQARGIGACGRYIRIETVTSPSWVSWREIEILGYNP